MDIERLTHQSYRVSVLLAVAASIIVVLLSAFMARGTLNLKGALALSEPTDVTVIAAVEPTLAADQAITGITFLRKESTQESLKPRYDYLVEISGVSHLVKLGWSPDTHSWTLMMTERLHGGESLTGSGAQAVGR